MRGDIAPIDQIENLPRSEQMLRTAVQLYRIQKEAGALSRVATCEGAVTACTDPSILCFNCILNNYAGWTETIGDVLSAYIKQYSPEDVVEMLL